MSGGSPESRGRDWVRGFVAPPIGFDAISAPADVLSRHGVPRRPDLVLGAFRARGLSWASDLFPTRARITGVCCSLCVPWGVG